jgi:MFS family permease
MSTDPRFDPAWRSRLRFYFAGFALSTAGDWLYGVVLTVYVYNRTHSALWIAGMNILRFLPYVVLAPVVGYVGDRWPQPRVMVGADAARATFMGVLATLVAADAPIAGVVAVATVSTSVSTLYAPAMNAMLAERVPPGRLGGVNATFSTIHSVALLVGPAAGAAMLAVGSPATAIAVNGATFVVSGIAVLSGAIPRPATGEAAADEPPAATDPGDDASASTWDAMVEGFHALSQQAYARVLVSAYTGVCLVYGTETVLLVLAAERRLHTGGSGYGLLLAAAGAGGIVAAPLVTRLTRAGRHTTGLRLAMLGAGLPLCCLALTTTSGVGYGLLAVDGASSVVIDVVVITLLQQATENTVTARAYAMLDGAGTAGMLVGMFAAPWLVSLFGLQTALVVSGVTLPAQLLFAGAGLRAVDARVRSMGAQPVEVADGS